MATLSKNNIALRGNWVAMEFPEAASQSYKVMDPVILSSGKVAIAVAAGSDVTSSTGFLGFAAKAASGTTDAKAVVWVPMGEDAHVRTSVDHATPGSAVTAVTQVGTDYVGTNSATGGLTIAIDTESNPVFTVVEIDPNYAVGEQYGWVWARPLASVAIVGRV